MSNVQKVSRHVDPNYLVMGACPICEGGGTIPAIKNDNDKEKL